VVYAIGRASEEVSITAFLDGINDWSLHRMTAVNRAILDGRSPRDTLRHDLAETVLPHLPSPSTLTAQQAQRLVVILGLAGASVGRHHQEQAEANRAVPEQAFAGLSVGPEKQPYVSYFRQLAERTGTGHGDRDSYASLVRWNLPQAEVHWAGQRIATLASVFDDGLVRSYTAAPDETRFFGLLKASEVLEKAVNQQLLPLSDGSVDLGDEEALRRIARSVLLLDGLRELNHRFAVLPAGQGLGVSYFMDVFRQYAVHWRAGDIPPSGAQDIEALNRDLILGIAMPSYPEHLRRLFPALLAGERALLETLLARASLPVTALRRAGTDATALTTCSESELRELVGREPVLAALHLLLNAHARVAGVHLMLSKRFLFGPQRVRDRDGTGDPGVVSNRTGTTGMDESRLEMLTRARHSHVLTPLRHLPVRLLEAAGRPDRIERELPLPSEVVVRFTGSTLSPQELGLPMPSEARVPERRVRS
jgi:hypothetical protein